MYTTVGLNNRAVRDQQRIVRFFLTRPVLQDGEGAQRINGFLEDFVSAYHSWIESVFLKEQRAKYESAERGERIHRFPADVRLHCLCREFGNLFSVHFTAEVSSGDESCARCASFVWDRSTGELMQLSDLAGKTFAAARRGWNFYLTDHGLRVYRADRHGKIVKREKYPLEKLTRHKNREALID